MKLFSFKKQKEQVGFAFRIEDVFALKDGGVVVAGQVTEGVICQGEQADCVPKNGSAFRCVIDCIEQPDPKYLGQELRYLHPREVRANDPLNGRCALRILDKNMEGSLSREDFHAGDRLVSVLTQEM